MTPMLSAEARDLYRSGIAAGGRLAPTATAPPLITDELIRLGLARRDGQGLLFLPPRSALAPRVAELNAQHDAVTRLTEELAVVWEQYTVAPQIEVLVGDAAGTTYNRLVDEARESISACCINSAPQGGEVGRVPTQTQTMARGVDVRAIYDVAVMGDPCGIAAVRESVADGERARVLPKVPLAFLVADDDVAAILPPYEHWHSRQMLLTHHRGLVQVMREFFDLLWDLAIEVRPTAWSQPVAAQSLEVERGDQILLLMAAGLGDHAIARELGISERTLSRRLAELQLRLGAKTRYQLGYQAALRMGDTAPVQASTRG